MEEVLSLVPLIIEYVIWDATTRNGTTAALEKGKAALITVETCS